jgi:hypothetical protein
MERTKDWTLDIKGVQLATGSLEECCAALLADETAPAELRAKPPGATDYLPLRMYSLNAEHAFVQVFKVGAAGFYGITAAARPDRVADEVRDALIATGGKPIGDGIVGIATGLFGKLAIHDPGGE